MPSDGRNRFMPGLLPHAAGSGYLARDSHPHPARSEHSAAQFLPVCRPGPTGMPITIILAAMFAPHHRTSG